MTPEKYKLYTGLTCPYSEEEWKEVVGVASMRLASFLCLDSLPELEDHQDLALLLASFIAAMIRFRGDGSRVQSKSVRNFTINFQNSTAVDVFSQIAEQYGDIIEKYSACESGVVVERSQCWRCCR